MIAAPFASERLTMRAQSIDDAPALHEAYRDAELMRYWSSAPHGSLEETVTYLTPRADHADWCGWTMRRREDAAVVGTLAATERRAGVYEIGYMVLRRYWNAGYAREGVSALIDRLFAAGARRMFADTDPDNAASNALLRWLGFTCEGRLRAEWETHIGVRDSLIWGLLRAEWPSS